MLISSQPPLPLFYFLSGNTSGRERGTIRYERVSLVEDLGWGESQGQIKESVRLLRYLPLREDDLSNFGKSPPGPPAPGWSSPPLPLGENKGSREKKNSPFLPTSTLHHHPSPSSHTLFCLLLFLRLSSSFLPAVSIPLIHLRPIDTSLVTDYLINQFSRPLLYLTETSQHATLFVPSNELHCTNVAI